MSRVFRERSRGGSVKPAPNQALIETIATSNMPVHPNHDLRSPFGDLKLDLSDSDLRETAYEILIAACQSTEGKPLSYISQSERSVDGAPVMPPATSLQRSQTSTAAGRVKKTLGLKLSSSSKRRVGGGEQLGQVKVKKTGTIEELMRVQMKISEQTDFAIRRGLLKIASGQFGRPMESMVLPLELLQQLKSSDFSSQQEYEIWQRRILKILDVGLLLSPRIPLENADTAPQHLRQIIRRALEKPIDAGNNHESIQTLRTTVTSLASRSFNGLASNECHWADGFPLNIKLYQMLLEACLDVNGETSIIEGVNEVLELIKKTWGVLGMDQMLHNLCFSWVLFHWYVAIGQHDGDLLFTSSNLLMEVENDANTHIDPIYSKALQSVLSSIWSWTEKRLLAYHDSFHIDNVGQMQNIVAMAVLSAKVLVQSNSHESKKKEVNLSCERVDTYIRSSLQAAFSQQMEKVKSGNYNSTGQISHRPVLSTLAQAIRELAFNEKAIFSPTLRSWQPHAAGIAVATLHSCYGKELKKFVVGVGELTPDALEVLNAADQLERDLVQIAVAESGESEDGGKSIIQQMPPYEAEAIISKLVKSWISTRVDRLKEWIDKFLQKEAWSPKENEEHFAPSAVEILRMIDETLNAYFLLPIPGHASLLHELMNGLDNCLQQYISKAKSGCGSRATFIPTLPALTRCTIGSTLGVTKKKEKLNIAKRRKNQFGSKNGDQSCGAPQLCVRINTLDYIHFDLGVLEKKAIEQLKTSESHIDNIISGPEKWFKLSSASCAEGIKQLCQVTAYKVIYHELSHVLWDGLYVGDLTNSKISLFLQELEQYLEIILSTVHDRVRTQVITDVMRTSFEGFLLVLLAGGPSRAFTKQDSEMIKEDFKSLTNLFGSNGVGLPADMIEKHSAKARGILPLFHTDSESLIEKFKSVSIEAYGSSAKLKLPLPPTSGQWNPTEPNTLLRVLCHRNDDTASKFLKKTYNLPRKL